MIGDYNYFPTLVESNGTFQTLDAAVRDFKAKYLRTAMMRSRGNQCKTASMLGVHRNTIKRLCLSLDVEPEAFKRKKAAKK